MYLVVNQTNRGTVLKALEKQPRDDMKSIVGLPVAFSRHLELTLTHKQAVEIRGLTGCKSMFGFGLPSISLFDVHSSTFIHTLRNALFVGRFLWSFWFAPRISC